MTNNGLASKVYVTHSTDINIELKAKRAQRGRRDSETDPEPRMMMDVMEDEEADTEQPPFSVLADTREVKFGTEVGEVIMV
jgi:hypothetical protein